ncbi:MAG: transposase [Flavobacteriaceae bacterium]|nr:transposase [Flavobacteriaceae bacterium]
MNAILHPKHKIQWLADAIDWSFFEKALEPLDAKTGRPSHRIRVMVGCLMLKRLDHLGDETLMDRWIEHPTMPYVTGSDVMNHQPPCDPSDLSHFRERMGQAGVEKIFAYSVSLHQKEIKKSSSMV